MSGQINLKLRTIIIVSLVIFLSILPTSVAQDDLEDFDIYEELFEGDTGKIEEVGSTPLILEVYIDESGKVLLAGYIDPEYLGNLTFLETSEHIFDNVTNELYVITDSLTSKQADKWTLHLSIGGFYTEGHITVYLPDIAVFKSVSCSEGLDYFVGQYNDSVIVDLQGFDLEEPAISLEYQQILDDGDITTPDKPDIPGTPDPLATTAPMAAAILVAVLILGIMLFVMKGRPTRDESGKEEILSDNTAVTAVEITSEMKKVIETLSERERAIIEALIKNEGRLTQADIRYETGIPKSSLSGIIYNLEKRNIITKKQKGRTNIIELSEWFISKKER
ncbi:MAG: hypothetical protein SVM80_03730 [Halobacteriota archaeon]|nr:hypothetical protein [Halobacteriota archaeon]